MKYRRSPKKPRVSAAIIGLSAALGCSSEAPHTSDCPGPQAAFEVFVHSTLGQFPADTTIRVTFTGGEEVYTLSKPEYPLEATQCHLVQGEHISPTENYIECQLWTEGPTRFEVTASGHQTNWLDLVHETDACGIKTVVATLQLGPPPND